MTKKTTTKVVSDTKAVKKPKTTTTKKRVTRKKASERVEPSVKTDVVPEPKILFSGTSGSVGNMMFSNVSLISTPYGKVTKITRKYDGKVLWNGGGSETGPYKFYQKSVQFMSNLKNLNTSSLPKIGDTIVFKEYTEGDNYYDIVGYDINVPEYVGYKNGSDVVYVRVWDDTNENTRTVAVGDKTYSRSFVTGGTYSTFTDTGNTVSAISGTFSYGNLNPFSVPATITAGGGVYNFCGHTMTVLSKNIVSTSKFGSDKVWKTSTIRSLISDNFGWERQEVLLKNMMKSCNITYGGNTLDQFFIPSAVELGHTHSQLKDDVHSKFKMIGNKDLDSVFRKKGDEWWTRSQNSPKYVFGVWYVMFDGSFMVFQDTSNQFGVVPAFVIG